MMTLFSTDPEFKNIKLEAKDYKEMNYIHIRRIELLKQDIFTMRSIKSAIAVRKKNNLKTMSTKRLGTNLTVQRSESVNYDELFKIINVEIKVKNYAPKVFHYIRHLDGIEEADIIKSIDPKLNRFQIFKSNTGSKHTEGGKSGSFFFFTEDNKFIIKSMKHSEMELLMKHLPEMV